MFFLPNFAIYTANFQFLQREKRFDFIYPQFMIHGTRVKENWKS